MFKNTKHPLSSEIDIVYVILILCIIKTSALVPVVYVYILDDGNGCILNLSQKDTVFRWNSIANSIVNPWWCLISHRVCTELRDSRDDLSPAPWWTYAIYLEGSEAIVKSLHILAFLLDAVPLLDYGDIFSLEFFSSPLGTGTTSGHQICYLESS